jgi:hypothetical protein
MGKCGSRRNGKLAKGKNADEVGSTGRWNSLDVGNTEDAHHSESRSHDEVIPFLRNTSLVNAGFSRPPQWTLAASKSCFPTGCAVWFAREDENGQNDDVLVSWECFKNKVVCFIFHVGGDRKNVWTYRPGWNRHSNNNNNATSPPNTTLLDSAWSIQVLVPNSWPVIGLFRC